MAHQTKCINLVQARCYAVFEHRLGAICYAVFEHGWDRDALNITGLCLMEGATAHAGINKENINRNRLQQSRCLAVL